MSETNEVANGVHVAAARPFLKWAGGKRQLLGELVPRVEAARGAGFKRYFEPFLGGGALFFELAAQGLLDGVDVYLSDVNSPLIETYVAVRDAVEAVIGELEAHKARHSEAHFYAVRAGEPAGPVSRAARIIYLNKTAYNGLYRVNGKGQFNVPYGRYKNPNICDAPNLRAVAQVLRGVTLELRPFEWVADTAERGDFVYFDPPYVPLSRTASFTKYSRGGFGDADQERLAAIYGQLDARGVRVLLSNSMSPRVRALYTGYAIDEVYAGRAVNSQGHGRGKVAEALVRNFPYPPAG